MADFNVRSDSVNVEQIMEQIRARIREKRGVDYTEQQIRELAAVKLEKFLDPRGVRSDLLEQFRKAQPAYAPPELPNYAFEAQTLYESTRPPLRWIRKLLNPILKLFFNPNPLIQALNIQSRLNTMYGEREARREATRRAFDQLQYELMHNMVIETTRMSIEVKNLKMRVESLASRLEFNERRARALESVVVYKPSSDEPDDNQAARRQAASREQQGRVDSGRQQPAGYGTPAATQPPPARDDHARELAGGGGGGSGQPPGQAQGQAEGPGQRSRRRRRRRGRRGGGPASAIMGGTAQPQPGALPQATSAPIAAGEAAGSSDYGLSPAASAKEAQQESSATSPSTPDPDDSPSPERTDQ
jgi:hypothetical protein